MGILLFLVGYSMAIPDFKYLLFLEKNWVSTQLYIYANNSLNTACKWCILAFKWAFRVLSRSLHTSVWHMYSFIYSWYERSLSARVKDYKNNTESKRKTSLVGRRKWEQTRMFKGWSLSQNKKLSIEKENQLLKSRGKAYLFLCDFTFLTSLDSWNGRFFHV